MWNKLARMVGVLEILAALVLAIPTIGACVVWENCGTYCGVTATVVAVAVTLTIAGAVFLLARKRARATGRKRYLLTVLIPALLFLSVIIFRNNIVAFVMAVSSPIGPGGMLPSQFD